jgi:thiosulfate/3-mercaptopyruvate sulfurtransferase
MKHEDPLVSTQWLEDHLNAPDVRIIDASWHLPTTGRDAFAEYKQSHIPGAVFFDIDDVCDDESPLPHMLPHPVKFTGKMRKLGLGDGSRFVVYDTEGLFSAARVWWMLRAMGHEDVVVLDGGFPKWVAEGRKIDDLPLPPRERHYTVRYYSELVRKLDDVKQALETGKEQVVDARPPERFRGDAPEPRSGVRSGHMPGAKNVHWATLLDKGGALLPAKDLKKRFAAAGVDTSRPVICSCGSGVSAGILALAMARLGHFRTPVYDGSWAEWGARDDLPIATGAG